MALDTLTGSAIGLPAPAATAGPTGGSFTQGGPLPNITTSQQQQTIAPSFYTDYLSNLATQGAQTAQGAKYAGAQPLQQQAFGLTGGSVGLASPYMQQALNALQQPGPGALTTASPYLQAATTGMGGAAAAAPFVERAVGTSSLAAFDPYAQQAAAMSGAEAARPFLEQAAGSTAQQVGKYMDPYTRQVVDVLGELGQRQIQRNLAPAATAAAVGSGQFGSARGADVLGSAINQGLLNTQSLQAQALQQGYGQSLQAAQADLARQLQAGQTMGSLTAQQANLLANLGQTAGGLTQQQAQNLLAAAGTTGQLTQSDLSRALSAGATAGQLAGTDVGQQLLRGQQLGALGTTAQAANLADINALATLGAQQQAIAQNEQLFPMQQLTNQAALLRGYTIPTSVSSTYTGPIPGAYAASPLQQIAGLGALAAGVSTTPLGSAIGSTLSKLIGGGLSEIGPRQPGFRYDPNTGETYETTTPSDAPTNYSGA